MSDLGFEHVHRAAADGSRPALLLLHGTGGDEHDLLPLGDMLLPGAALLSPRGKVLEHGMPRFFRRLAEGVFDEEDIRRRAAELAEFVTRARTEYGLDRRIVAAGFSNGANIASALLLLHPGVLFGAALFRAMVPLVPEPVPSLEQAPVLISNGQQDPTVTTTETERLAGLLRRSGAEVTLEWQPGGHQLTRADIDLARDWLQALAAPPHRTMRSPG